ncbi:hypothetical protein FHS09_001957 [Microbulbifer rhizosphaerae]|uniref:Uncharacterized protein n=1 Tax=Microbulbifer rhizosphaerae TaxID=1562603 RepID=A0A7W4WBA8_9GAMM|nr:hypothetical protein [Microbulbifer rhizosphaerae]
MLAGHMVIRQSGANTLITEEPDELKLTSGSVGGAAREGGSYPERNGGKQGGFLKR